MKILMQMQIQMQIQRARHILSGSKLGTNTSAIVLGIAIFNIVANSLAIGVANAETVAPIVTNTTINQAAKSEITQLELLPVRSSQVAADGRSTVKFEGRLLDKEGQLVPSRAIVTLTSSAGKFIGADQDTDLPGFQVLAIRGKFTAELQSDLEAKKVRVRAAIAKHLSDTDPAPKPLAPDASFTIAPNSQNNPNAIVAASTNFQDISTYTQVEFIPNLRSPIVAGVINVRIGASGTDYFGSYRDFLNPDRLAEGTRLDVDTAVFATGKVGDWLITGAINNQRPLNQTCDGNSRLFRDTQSCDQVYPVFGDSSKVDYLAPSIDSVYFKAERQSPIPNAGTDYAMWGDYNSQEFATASQLYSATTRQLHGLKANYNFGNLQATIMYGNNLQSFRRDAIAPDGTSGYYFLSQRLVIPGSENVFIETEELGRPGTVIERKSLTRTADYEIDYDRGAFLFRRPMLRTEFDLFGRSLVRKIIVTYQSDSQGNEASLYAGRLQYNLSRVLGRESWLGTSYLKESQGIRNFELYGADAIFPLGDGGQIIAEISKSNNDSIYQGAISGTAYRFEVNGKLSESILARAYYRTVDQGFSNTGTLSFNPGQTRYGVDVASTIARGTRLKLQFDREENFGIATADRSLFGFSDLFNPQAQPIPGSRVDNNLTTLRAGLSQTVGSAELAVDYVNRTRSDRSSSSLLNNSSSQLVSSFSFPIAKSLTLRAQNELNLGSSDFLYPDRTTVGLDWAVMPGITMRLAHQFFTGGAYRQGAITSLDTLMDQRLTDDTSVTGRYSLLNGANGLTGQGALGLNHRMILAPGLRMNLAYEHIFGDIYTYTGTGQQLITPYAVGQSGASLATNSGDSYSIGLDYTDNPNFKASTRFEHRFSSVGTNTVFSAAVNGKISPALTTLFRYQQANYSNVVGLGDTSNLKLGLAYRDPKSDKFNVLLRYEYRKNPSSIPDTLLFGTGTGGNIHLFSTEAIYAPNWRWEFYGKVGLRSTESYLASNLINSNTILFSQLRTTYHFNDRWDAVGAIRSITQTTTGFNEIGLALEAGYYLTPNLRVGAGYSFGRASDPDVGDRSRGGFYAGLQFKLNELFDGFGLQKTAPPQQQEAKKQPIAMEK
jgi:hypothetical protein